MSVQKRLVKVYCPKCKRSHSIDLSNDTAGYCFCKCGTKIEAFIFFGQDVLINSTIQLPYGKHIVLIGNAKYYSVTKDMEIYCYYSNDILKDYAYMYYNGIQSNIIYGSVAYKIIRDEVAYLLYDDGTVELLEKSA